MNYKLCFKWSFHTNGSRYIIVAIEKRGLLPIRKRRDYVCGIWQYKVLSIKSLFESKIIWEEKWEAKREYCIKAWKNSIEIKENYPPLYHDNCLFSRWILNSCQVSVVYRRGNLLCSHNHQLKSRPNAFAIGIAIFQSIQIGHDEMFLVVLFMWHGIARLIANKIIWLTMISQENIVYPVFFMVLQHWIIY